MRIAVVGAGGVGGYFGGRLAQAGFDVTFIARGAQLAALRTTGLRVESVRGDFHLNPVQATDDPRQAGTADVVLMTVKAWQLREAAESIRPLLGPETFVVPVENGVDAADQLIATLGASRVVGGLCGIVSFIVAPGHIRHAAIDPFIRFGELDRRPSARLEALRAAFTTANVTAEVSSDIHVDLWRKFLFVQPAGAIGALTRSPTGVWMKLPATRRIAEDGVREIIALAKARGVALPESAFSETLARLDSMPNETTMSMQRDIMAGKPSELDAQVGAIVRLGEAANVPTPVHSFMYACLAPQEMLARADQRA